MSGRFRPITVCDRVCAIANECRIGGYQCEDCRKWYCVYDVEDYRGMTLCGECAESRRAEDEEENDDAPAEEQKGGKDADK